MSLIKKINDPNGKKYDDFSIGSLVLDTEPIPGSFNPVTSDGVKNAIDDSVDAAKAEMQEKIDEVTLDPSAVALGNVHLLDEVTEFPADGCILIDSETNGPGEMSKDTLLKLTAQNAGKTNKFLGVPFYYERIGYLKHDGTFSDSNEYHCLATPRFNVVEGQEFIYSGYGGSSVASAVFFDSSNSVVSSTYANTTNGKACAFAKIVVPENAVSAIFSSFNVANSDIEFSVVLKNCPKDQENSLLAKTLADMSLNLYSEHDGYVQADGTFGGTDTYHCMKTGLVPVSEGEIYLLRAIAASSARGVVYFDSDLNIVSALEIRSFGEPLKKVVVPSGVSYAIFSSTALKTAPVVFDVVKLGSARWESICEQKRSEFVAGNVGLYPHVGYMQPDFTFNSSDSYHCVFTDYIPVNAGEALIYRGRGSQYNVSVAFFDSSLSLLSVVGVNSQELQARIVVHNDAEYAVFSSMNDVADKVCLECYLQDSTVAQRVFKDAYDRVCNGSVRFYEHVGYLQSNFTFNSSTSYHCVYTDYIPVKEGQVFLYRGKASASDGNYPRSVFFFNSAFELVSYAGYNSAFGFTEITIPSGVSFAVFSSYHQSTKIVPFDLTVKYSPASERTIPGETDLLKGKVWYACGDSFTAGGFDGYAGNDQRLADGIYEGQYCVYPYVIGNRTGCDVRNIAVSGSTLSEYNEAGFTKSEDGLLYTTDFSDADYITLYFGINDSGRVSVGTIDDATNTTFYGALNVALEYLITNYPKAKIGIVCSNRCDTAAFPEAAKQAAIKWGVPYLDLDGGVGCPTMLGCSSRNPACDAVKQLRWEQQSVSSTNHHPNPMAHRLEASFIETWLKSL